MDNGTIVELPVLFMDIHVQIQARMDILFFRIAAIFLHSYTFVCLPVGSSPLWLDHGPIGCYTIQINYIGFDIQIIQAYDHSSKRLWPWNWG